MGFLRRDVPRHHPDFGKPLKCDGVAHRGDELARLNKISRLSEAELKLRLAQIAPYNEIIKSHCPTCDNVTLTHFEIEKNKVRECPKCGATFYADNASNEAMLECAQTIVNGQGQGYWWWCGLWGNAKSAIGKAVVNECNLGGHGPAMYITFEDTVEYIKEAWSGEGEKESARLNQLIQCPVLVVDELDKSQESAWLYKFRSRFLDKRYNHALHSGKYSVTVVISNLHPLQFDDGALRSRFRHGGVDRVITNTAPDVRTMMGWE